MRLKYRVLQGRFDTAAFLSNWEAQMAQDRLDYKRHWKLSFWLLGPLGGGVWMLLALPLAAGLRLLNIFEAMVSGARLVEATESEATEGELQALLVGGRVKRTDLVLIEGQWQSFSDSVAFEDTCHELERKGRWFEALTWCLTAVLAFALVAFLVWCVVSSYHWLLYSGRE